jgi:hypothetical protein
MTWFSVLTLIFLWASGPCLVFFSDICFKIPSCLQAYSYSHSPYLLPLDSPWETSHFRCSCGRIYLRTFLTKRQRSWNVDNCHLINIVTWIRCCVTKDRVLIGWLDLFASLVITINDSHNKPSNITDLSTLRHTKSSPFSSCSWTTFICHWRLPQIFQ